MKQFSLEVDEHWTLDKATVMGNHSRPGKYDHHYYPPSQKHKMLQSLVQECELWIENSSERNYSKSIYLPWKNESPVKMFDATFVKNNDILLIQNREGCGMCHSRYYLYSACVLQCYEAVQECRCVCNSWKVT